MNMLAQATGEQLHVIILLTLFEGGFGLEAAADVVGKDSRLLQGQLQVGMQLLFQAQNSFDVH